MLYFESQIDKDAFSTGRQTQLQPDLNAVFRPEKAARALQL
jgi:hypothetical protein